MRLTNKCELATSLSYFMRGPNAFLPPTYQIHFGSWYGQRPDNADSHGWILKKADEDGGRGIQLITDVDTCLANVDPAEQYVVQPLIADPKLLDGHKFDIRCYVVLVQSQDCYRAYVSKRGYIRKCKNTYSSDDLSNSSQLSNLGLVEPQDDPASIEDRVELFEESLSWYEQVHSQIKTIVYSAIASVTCGARRPQARFHLFACDFLVDSSNKPWLLEFNNSPGFAAAKHPEVGEKLISPAIDGLVDVAIEPLLNKQPPKSHEIWALAFDENEHG